MGVVGGLGRTISGRVGPFSDLASFEFSALRLANSTDKWECNRIRSSGEKISNFGAKPLKSGSQYRIKRD